MCVCGGGGGGIECVCVCNGMVQYIMTWYSIYNYNHMI